MNFTLHGLDDGSPDREIRLTGTPLRIGRDPNVDILIDDEGVSRFHCQIDEINGTLWVRDLGSDHGIFVNGFQVVQSHLMPGDRLTVGATSFRVEYERRALRRTRAVSSEVGVAT